MITFPLPITELLDKINDVYRQISDINELKVALEQAKIFHNRSRSQFLFFNKIKSDSDKVNKLNEFLNENYNRMYQEFDKLVDFINTGKVETLFSASLGIQETSYLITKNSQALNKIKEKSRTFSPFLMIDDFIKLGINVYNEKSEKKSILEKIPFLVTFKETIHDDCYKFEECYPEAEEIIDELEQSLEDIERGIGAVYIYTQNENKEDLLNGLKILGNASRKLYDYLNKMGHYKVKYRYNPNPYIDEFLCYFDQFLAKELPFEQFTEAIYEFRNNCKNINEEIEQYLTDFMPGHDIREEVTTSIEERLEYINIILDKLEEAIFAEIIDEDYIEELFMQIQDETQELYDSKKEFHHSVILQEKNLSEDVEIMQLRDIIKGIYKKNIPLPVLHEFLLNFNGRTQLLNNRIAQLTCCEEENINILRRAIKGRKKIWEETNLYISDRQYEHLFNALEIIEENFNEIKGLDEAISEREYNKNIEENLVICVKCSHRNTKAEKKCRNCGTLLPFTINSNNIISLDIVDKKHCIPQDKIRFEMIKTLKLLTEKVIKNKSKSEELQLLLDEIINKTITIRKQFTDFMKPILGKNTDNMELTEKFYELYSIFDGAEESFEYMKCYFSVEGNGEEYLKAGLENVLIHTKKLEDFQDRMRDILNRERGISKQASS